MKTLYAGPWVGELGWELFGWQSHIRALAPLFDRVIVSTRPGHEALYADFCDQFEPIEQVPTETSGHVAVGFDYDDRHTRYIKNPGDLWVGPMSFTEGPEDFVVYGRPGLELAYDVVVHARATSKLGTGSRNWPLEHWTALVERWRNDGLTVACVGSLDAALCPPGAVDLRGRPMQEVMDVLASSRLMVGPSSGPMHLASLCRCPHLVWTDNAYQEVVSGTNRQRYERLWNPFRTPVSVVDQFGWQPPLDAIWTASQAMLAGAPARVRGGRSVGSSAMAAG